MLLPPVSPEQDERFRQGDADAPDDWDADHGPGQGSPRAEAAASDAARVKVVKTALYEALASLGTEPAA